MTISKLVAQPRSTSGSAAIPTTEPTTSSANRRLAPSSTRPSSKVHRPRCPSTRASYGMGPLVMTPAQPIRLCILTRPLRGFAPVAVTAAVTVAEHRLQHPKTLLRHRRMLLRHRKALLLHPKTLIQHLRTMLPKTRLFLHHQWKSCPLLLL